MGSDMAMEAEHWHPRPSYAEWDGDDLVIYKDNLFRGYQQFWKGPVTNDNRSLLLKLVKEIPVKPLPVESKEAQIAHLLVGKGPISDAEAAYVAHQITQIMES